MAWRQALYRLSLIHIWFRNDEGTQPTTIDPISPNFDALSQQPSWDAQFGETHIFGPHATNEFVASLSHYQAQFLQNDQTVLSTLPYGIAMSGLNLSSIDSEIADFPQGRNITQWQLIDNYTVNKGRHTLKSVSYTHLVAAGNCK